MNSTLIRFVAGFCFCLMSCSCVKNEMSKRVLTEAQALELAKQEFIKTGRRVEDYGVSSEREDREQKWIVWFDLRGNYPPPGSKHAVTVEDETGRVVFMPGE